MDDFSYVLPSDMSAFLRDGSAYTLILFCIWFSFFNGSTAPWRPRPPHFSRLHDHTFRHTTLGRTPLDEGPARHRDLYMTTHNTHKTRDSNPQSQQASGRRLTP